MNPYELLSAMPLSTVLALATLRLELVDKETSPRKAEPAKATWRPRK